MRSTASSRPTSRCAWRRRRAGTRASSPRRSSRRCRQARSSRAPRSPAPASSTFTWPRPPTRASSPASTNAADAYGESTLGAGERVLVEFVSANPTGPLHVGHGRQAAYGATLANVLHGGGLSRSSASTTSTTPAARWTSWRSAPGCATSRPAGEALPFPQNGYRGDYVRPLAQKLQAAAGRGAAAPRRQVLANLPADAPAGDKEAYIDALIARCRELIGADGFREVLELSLEQMLADIRDDLAEFGVAVRSLDLRARARRERRDRSRARGARVAGPPVAPGRRAVVPRQRVRRREGSRGGARERPEDLLRLRHRLPPRQVRARLRAPHRRARRRPPRLRRARARGAHRHGAARRSASR